MRTALDPPCRQVLWELMLAIAEEPASGTSNDDARLQQHHHAMYSKELGSHDPRLSVLGGKYGDKDSYLSDLRVEVERERPPRHGSHSYLRTKSSMMRTLVPSKASIRTTPVTTPASITHEPTGSVTPCTSHGLRRCQSASAVRKKLFNAVEQGNSSGHHHPNHKLQAQIDALRSLTAASAAKTPMKPQLGYHSASGELSSAMTSAYGLGKPLRVATGTSNKEEDCIAGVGIGPARSASFSASESPQRPASASVNSVQSSAPIFVGGYRSSSVQLEVELVERLNEIGRSNLKEKALLRTRACQQVLDSVVQQDEHYGRLLSRIRDEVGIYVDITSRKSPIEATTKKPAKHNWCACGQDVFEFALVRQENTALKKRVNTLQLELEGLQAALRQARVVNDNNSNRSSLSGPENDTAEDDLDDVLLFPLEKLQDQSDQLQRVPMLSFASLPVYNEEEEDEEALEEHDEYY